MFNLYFTLLSAKPRMQPLDQSKHLVKVKTTQWQVQSRIMWYLTFQLYLCKTLPGKTYWGIIFQICYFELLVQVQA